MDVRLITVREDFEKAYNILNRREYPLSFYEYSTKHDHYSNLLTHKLIGAFVDDQCMGTISYKITNCKSLGRVLDINEINQKSIKAHKVLLDFIDQLAKDEDCKVIRISKEKKIERSNNDIFDRFENFLKNLIQ